MNIASNGYGYESSRFLQQHHFKFLELSSHQLKEEFDYFLKSAEYTLHNQTRLSISRTIQSMAEKALQSQGLGKNVNFFNTPLNR